MVEIETAIETARRNLRDSEARVERQRETVDRLETNNRPTGRSEKVLATFEHQHRLRTSYLKLLEAKAGSEG